MTETGKSVEKRYRMLDLLRGVTVFIMIAAHAVYFFHNDTNGFLGLVEIIGNTVAFTVFLIVSGATAEIAYFSKEEIWPERRKRLFRRIRVLTLGYFALAFAVFFAEIISTYGFAKLYLIFDILTLRKLPPFGEFYIPFIIFPLIICLFPKIFRKIARSFAWALVLGLAVYAIGMLLYNIAVPDFLVPWKALLVGAEGYYRFPLFQYFPVYLLGLAWGYFLLSAKEYRHQVEFAKGVLFTTILGLGLTIVPLLTTGKALSEIMKRWPPSIPFLLAGIFFAALLAYFLYRTKQLKRTPLLREGLLVFGQNALGLALIHVFLLQIYSLAGGLRTGSVFLYLIGLIILLILSVALAAVLPFNFRFALNLERGNYHEEDLEKETLVKFEEEAEQSLEKDVSRFEKYFFIGKKVNRTDQRLVKKRHILAASLALGLTAFIILPPVGEQYQMQIAAKKEISWFDPDFGWRQNLSIKNQENLAELQKGQLVRVPLDLASLASAKKAYLDGRDLTVQYWDGETYQPVRFWYSTETQEPSGLYLELKERIKPGSFSENYFLYYGNNLAKTSAQKTKISNLAEIRYQVETKKEEDHPLLLTVDRRWSLLSDDPKIQKNLRVSLTAREDYAAEEALYLIEGIGTTGKLEKTGAKTWEGVVSTVNLPPGEYQISATIANEGKSLNSSNAGFLVSEPLYIAWTQDWEGYDVPDNYLSAISQIASEHGLTMTHFWNPRLTVTASVAENRKNTLLKWIKNRESAFGENVELHLHMFSDFVQASGVTPINTPNWGDSGDGYGSLTTNYSAEEMTKIISQGVKVMRESGFLPKIFRAGGWFANLETLKAVQASGLSADSSGRTAYQFYGQKGPWDLSPTAQPYHPSTTNQNQNSNPSFSILEIPNNGADSYWFSSNEMISRFHQNYSGGILSEPKQVTYLSHPHWFNKSEQLKIESLFNLIDSYKYENDAGPAIYVGLEKIYQAWSK